MSELSEVRPRRSSLQRTLGGECGQVRFRKGHLFLTMVQPSNATQDVRWTSALAVKNPCLINIASTMYRKIRDKVAKVTTCSNAYPTLIEALWVLFMRSNSSPARQLQQRPLHPLLRTPAVSKPPRPKLWP
ncbi:hypothetical protein DPEC_G00376480 [Dallia pectoralis]|nr:hypothetical protein DPEC_G00376480 [Dallia pectoralis]